VKRIAYPAFDPPMTICNQTLDAATPAAAANTDGTPQTLHAKKRGWLLLQQVTVSLTGTFTTETVTTTMFVTFSDNSTSASWTLTGTTPTGGSPLGVSSNDIAGLMHDNVLVSSITVAVKSTAADSQVTATTSVVALQV